MARQITLKPDEYHPTVQDKVALSDWEAVLKEEDTGGAGLFGPIMAGLFTLVFGIGGFFYWAAHTEVAQASVASGKVIVESKTKTVTHLEGGTLKALAVSEGQSVKEGDVLATLDVTRSQATLTQLRQQLFAAQARMARLVAEKNLEKSFSYQAPTPEGMSEAAAKDLIATEVRLFDERTTLLRDQIAADQAGIEQLASQRVALEARRKTWAEQAILVRREYETFDALSRKKLVTRNVVSDKKLQLLDMETRIAESDASLSENDQKKTQLELSLTGRRNEYFRVLSEQIQEGQAGISRITQEIVAASDVVSKAAIRSPQDGIIANIRIRAPGSAVISGQPVLDIVPANQPMIIEGHAKPMDIDQIKVGDRTDIKLSAFGSAELKPLIGHITYIAPDGTTDERTGETLFLFRARLDPAELAKQKNLFLYPGMTAEVYIVNGNRTALAYLIEPATKSFYRAFREQ